MYKKRGKTSSLQPATAVFKETEQKKTNKRQQRNCALLWFCKLHILHECAREHHADFPTHQVSFSLGCLCWSPQSARGRAVWEHAAPDRTSLPTGEHQHQLPSPSTAGPLLPLSAALPRRNAFSLHLGIQTIPRQEWQQNNTNTSQLQSAQCCTNTLTSKVLPDHRDAEDRRLKACSEVRLKSLPCFTVTGKAPATFLKANTLQQVKNALQACLVVCAALKG